MADNFLIVAPTELKFRRGLLFLTVPSSLAWWACRSAGRRAAPHPRATLVHRPYCRFELRKNVPCTLTLQNPTGERVAFKVKTTSPKKYCVRPSSGFVEPGSSKEVQVIMQAQREYPPSLAGAPPTRAAWTPCLGAAAAAAASWVGGRWVAVNHLQHMA